MADPVSEDEFQRRYVELRGLLARGVPWPIAREALASTALDRDQTHTIDAFTCPRCGRTSWNPHDIAERYCGACHDASPSWWREDDDGVRIVDRD